MQVWQGGISTVQVAREAGRVSRSLPAFAPVGGGRTHPPTSLLTQEGGVRDLGHDVVLHRVHVQAAHTRPPHVGQHA